MTFRIRTRHRLWLLFTAIAALLFVFVQHRLGQMLSLFVMAVTALAWLWTMAARPQAVRVTVRPDRVMAGEPVHTDVRVTGSWLPLPWLAVTDMSPVWPRAPRYVRTLAPRQQVSCEEQLRPQRRGVYALGPITVRWGDPFGLFETAASLVPPPATLTVYPRVVHLLHVPVPLRLPFGLRRPRPAGFEDVTAPSEQRPYRPGDSLRRINWKATARLGELYTREYDHTATTDLHIVLDLAATSYDRTVTGVSNDEPAAELAAAVAEFGLRTGLGVSLTTYAPDRRHVSVQRGRLRLRPFLELLAAAPPVGTVSVAEAIRLEMQQFDQATVAIVISPDTSPALASALAELRQRRVHVVVLTVGPEGTRAVPRWHETLQALGIQCLDVSGPEQLNEGGAAPWPQSVHS